MREERRTRGEVEKEPEKGKSVNANENAKQRIDEKIESKRGFENGKVVKNEDR